MNLPQRIFAIGGAGKEIGMEILESDWVLRDVLKPRPNPRSLKITILDTASEEQNSDIQRINDIRQNVADIRSELQEESDERAGDVDVDYKLITENIMLNSRIDLIGDEVVPRITAGRGMDEDNWWLEDSHIEEDLNFAKGAVRKRGLGKAMFYKSYAEDDELSTKIDLPTKGEVAIVAGLGGGTGSGIFIDVAQELSKKMPTADLTLFGVLPNHTEGLRENANTFAALSELEQLSLNEENLFKDCILMPLGPTGFDGKRGNRVESDRMLQEFDEAVVYLIASYYNNQGMEDVFQGSPDFAPFTIGIPQVLRYNVEAINDSRESFQELLDEKQEALQAESDIYEEFEIFIEKHFTEVEGGLRGEDESELEDRLSRFESLIDFELFDQLEYEAVEIFDEIIADATRESDDIGEQLDVIAGSLRAGLADPADQTTYVDNVDAHLAEVLKQELELLVRRKDMLERKTAIENNRIQRTCEHLLGADKSGTSAGGTIRLLENEIEEKQEKHERLTEELEQATSDLEQLREEQADEIASDVDSWYRSIQPFIDEMEAIDVDQAETELEKLNAELQEYAGSIKNSESVDEVENVSKSDIHDRISAVEALLSQVDIGMAKIKTDIKESLSALEDAKEASITLDKDESAFENIAPWKSSTEEQKEEAQKTYTIAKNRLTDPEIFSIGPPTDNFTVDVEFNEAEIMREIDRRTEEIEAAIIDELNNKLDDEVQESSQRELEREINRADINIEAIRAIAEKELTRELEGTDELVDEIDSLERRIDSVESDIEIYESTIDLFEAVSNRRRKFEEHQSSFNEMLSSLDDSAEISVGAESEDYVFIKNIQPEQVFRATGSDNLADTGLFKNENERYKLRSNLEELASNAIDRKYTGLQRRKFSHNGERYHGLRVRVALLSQAINNLDGDDLDLQSYFKESFDLEGSPTKQRYSAWSSEIGSKWDIGLSVFIDGVFIDNIRKAVQADGYYSGYQQWEQKSEVDIRVHHSYALDEGYFTRRKSLLNTENPEEVQTILQDENDVVNELLDDYHETIEFGASEAVQGSGE